MINNPFYTFSWVFGPYILLGLVQPGSCQSDIQRRGPCDRLPSADSEAYLLHCKVQLLRLIIPVVHLQEPSTQEQSNGTD